LKQMEKYTTNYIDQIGWYLSFAALCNGKRQLHIAYFYAIPIAVLVALY